MPPGLCLPLCSICLCTLCHRLWRTFIQLEQCSLRYRFAARTTCLQLGVALLFCNIPGLFIYTADYAMEGDYLVSAYRWGDYVFSRINSYYTYCTITHGCLGPWVGGQTRLSGFLLIYSTLYNSFSMLMSPSLDEFCLILSINVNILYTVSTITGNESLFCSWRKEE